MHSEVEKLVERLRDKHYIADADKVKMPEPVSDLVFLMRQERMEAASLIERLCRENEQLRAARRALSLPPQTSSSLAEQPQ